MNTTPTLTWGEAQKFRRYAMQGARAARANGQRILAEAIVRTAREFNRKALAVRQWEKQFS